MAINIGQIAIENDGLFHWNAELYQWERLDKTQEYKGHIIQSISTHDDSHNRYSYHRYYRVTYPSGRVSDWYINKRGGNIRNLKEYIDFNIEHNRVEYL